MNKLTHDSGRRAVRCILFDLGYTLWDRRRNPQLWSQVEAASNRHAVSILRRHLPADLLPAGSDDVLGERLRERFDVHEHDMIRRDPAHEPDGALAVLWTLKEWGIEPSDTVVGKLVFEALNVRIPDSLPLLEDALPTLSALKQRGFLLGIVTNRLWGGEAFRQDLRALGLLDYFDEVGLAVSADLGVRKPNPALFWHVLNGLQVTPQQTAMVGDSLRTDILGAQKLGLYTVWLPRPKQREPVQEYLASSQQRRIPSSAKPLLQQPSGAEAAAGTSFYDEDYMPANMQGRDGYLERFLRGEIQPNVIIEKVSDLLDIFLPAEMLG